MNDETFTYPAKVDIQFIYDHDYELGADVTHLFRATRKSQMAVVSVRLPVSLITELEITATAEGRTVSAYIRRILEAGKSYEGKIGD